MYSTCCYGLVYIGLHVTYLILSNNRRIVLWYFSGFFLVIIRPYRVENFFVSSKCLFTT